MNPAEESLSHYFRGMARHDKALIQAVADFGDWQSLAARLLAEQQARQREELLRSLPLDDLQAIAEGRLDLPTAARAAITPRA